MGESRRWRLFRLSVKGNSSHYQKLRPPVLADGSYDVSGVVAVIAAPDLPAKARNGQLETLAPCIGCLPNMFAGKPITCAVNPCVGREAGEVLLKSLWPDAVILATGSTPLVLPIPGNAVLATGDALEAALQI